MRLTIKDHIRESRLFNERAAIALFIVAILLSVSIARLVYLQILSHEHFSTLSDENRISLIPVPPTRGLIYDRNGVALAQNLPAFSLVLIPEQIADMDATVVSNAGQSVKMSFSSKGFDKAWAALAAKP